MSEQTPSVILLEVAAAISGSPASPCGRLLKSGSRSRTGDQYRHIVSARERARARSASRTARSRTPRCRSACRPPARAPAPGSCRRRSRGSCRHACRRRSVRVRDSLGADAVAGDRLRQPEVEHLHVPVGRDLDVRRLQVAVDDPLLVRGFERLGDLPRDRERLCERQAAARARSASCPRASRPRPAPAPAPGRRRTPRRRRSRRCADDSGDASMRASRSNRARRSGSVSEGSRQDLDRDVASQLRVARAIHLAHAACANLRRRSRYGPSGAGRSGSLAPMRSATAGGVRNAAPPSCASSDSTS